MLNRSSIIQIETPPHPSRACQSALQLAYLRLLVITWLTQSFPLPSPSTTPALHPQPRVCHSLHLTRIPGAASSLPYLLELGAEEPGQFYVLGKQGGVGLCSVVVVLFGLASANSSTCPGFSYPARPAS